MSFRRPVLLAALIAAVTLTGCATDEYGNRLPTNDTTMGAIIGTLGGAAVGAAINHKNRGKGALIGAVGGGLAGAGVGYYMDQQARDFQKQLASQIQAGAIDVQKRADNTIMVTMTSATAFDTNSAALKPGFMPTLDTISRIVNKYGKTTLIITGHTDSSGNDRINVPLSQNRAKSVYDYFLGKQVNSQRLGYQGVGASRPRASNATEYGKQMNRRVEVLIEPVVAN